MNLEDCLSADLLPATLTKIGVGQSGAGVYRVEAQGGKATYVLKVAPPSASRDTWQATIAIQRAAAEAGVAPRIVHVDDEHLAVVSEHVVDRGFPMLLMNPATRGDAIQQLGKMLGTLHAVPVPPGTSVSHPRKALAAAVAQMEGFAIPAFATEQIQRMLAEDAPGAERKGCLSHNDVNPTNLVFDGARLVMLDWDVAAVNDPLYDLAAAAMFFRFDDATSLALLSAHDGQAVAELPPRFVHLRRLVGTMCGTVMLQLARMTGHGGSTGETIESTPALVEFYGKLRTGAVNMGAADGRWQFGLALLKNATAL